MFTDSVYNPEIHGIVTAMRIYTDYENGCDPIAELLFAFGGSDAIRWNDINERNKYIKGINAYTLVFDERVNPALSKTFREDRACPKSFDELRDQATQIFFSNKCRIQTSKGES